MSEPKFGPAKWAALDNCCGVKETLKFYIDPVLASEKHAVINDICAVAVSAAVAAAQELLKQNRLEGFVVVSTTGPHIFIDDKVAQ